MRLHEAIKQAWSEGNHIMTGKIADRLRAQGANYSTIEECFSLVLNRPTEQIRARLAELLTQADEEQQENPIESRYEAATILVKES